MATSLNISFVLSSQINMIHLQYFPPPVCSFLADKEADKSTLSAMYAFFVFCVFFFSPVPLHKLHDTQEKNRRRRNKARKYTTGFTENEAVLL